MLAGTQAARIAQGLQLASAAASTRCTECHAPLATVAEERLAHGLDVRTEGVSCESCHGPSSNWIRSHTRMDLTHAQNVETGVRDLRSLYVRANNCVACHQVIEPDVLAAGHPPLIFELDAQTVAEPRHWLDKGDFFGPQAWLTGQAAALRETSWSLSQQTDPKPEVREQWRALVWLLHKATEAYGHGVPTFDAPDADTYSPGNVSRAQSVADDLAQAAARSEWNGASTRRTLNALADADKDFVPVTGGEPALALQNRAQRLGAGALAAGGAVPGEGPGQMGGHVQGIGQAVHPGRRPGEFRRRGVFQPVEGVPRDPGRRRVTSRQLSAAAGCLKEGRFSLMILISANCKGVRKLR